MAKAPKRTSDAADEAEVKVAGAAAVEKPATDENAKRQAAAGPKTGSVGPGESGVAAALADPATGTETAKAMNIADTQTYDPKDPALQPPEALDIVTSDREADARREAELARDKENEKFGGRAVDYIRARTVRAAPVDGEPEIPARGGGADPQIGLPVYYRAANASNGIHVAPAVVTRVHEDNYDGRRIVNLTVFPDGGAPYPVAVVLEAWGPDDEASQPKDGIPAPPQTNVWFQIEVADKKGRG